MENPSYVALSRQMVLQHRMDIIANNIANASTPAFKGERLMFAEYLARTSPAERLSYVRDVATVRDTGDGEMTHTGNTLDVALHGRGYFVVDTAQGTRYTRNGHLNLDAAGRLVTGQGHPVLGEGTRPLIIGPSAKSIDIARDGTVSTDNGVVGRIQIVRFANDQDLRQVGNGLYVSAQQPVPAADAAVVQGMVEESNVQPILEITRMIETVRAYQSTQRLIETEHDLQRESIRRLSQSS